jgi:hypothetical protein
LETWSAELDGQVFLTGNTITSTFDSYAGQFEGLGPYNPFANIYAALNYARNVYGPTLMSNGRGIGSGHGYAAGGIISEPVFGLGLHSRQPYSFAENAPEMVTPMHNIPGGRGDTHIYNITVKGDSDPDGAARRIHQTLRDYKRRKGGQPLGIS